MADIILHIIDDVLFFCIALSGIYLFIFALLALFRSSEKYQKAEKKHRFAILIPVGSNVNEQKYPKELYSIFIYEDLFQTIMHLDSHYDVVIVLGKTTRISPRLLEKINNAYATGAIAIQLHHIIEYRPNRKIRWQAIHEEIRNSIFKQGHTQAGLSSALDKTDIAIDLTWLKNNMKSAKSNLESRLLRQNIFIEYIANARVFSSSPRPRPHSMSKWKAITKLPVTLMSGNRDYADKLFRQLLPSWQLLFVITSLWCLLITLYDWKDSIKWWGMLFGLLFTICLAIPDYLVENKKK